MPSWRTRATPLASRLKCPLPKQMGWTSSHPPGSLSHKAAGVLRQSFTGGRQAHRPQAIREPYPGEPSAPPPTRLIPESHSPDGLPPSARRHTRPCVCTGAATHTSYTPSGCSHRPGTCTQCSHGVEVEIREPSAGGQTRYGTHGADGKNSVTAMQS